MGFVVVPRPYDDPEVVRMVAAVQEEYVRIYGEPDAATIDVSELAPPLGVLFVGVLDGETVAMGGWRRLAGPDGTVAELKRMYVDPRVRLRGLSRLILAQAERTAVEAGIRELVLNTGPGQQAAVTLYERSGYRPVAPFGHYASTGDALFYGKRLDELSEP